MRPGLALLLAVFGCGDAPVEQSSSAVAAPSGSVTVASASASTSAGPSGSRAATKSTQERWGGRIDIPGNAPLMFELRFASDQPFAATIAIPAQKLLPTDLKDVSIAGENMNFTLALPNGAESTHARFSLQRAAGQGTATGTLRQHGSTMQVSMRRLAEGEVLRDESHPQTPLPPFPYDEREASFTSKDGTKIAGTLTLPKKLGKHPAVMLITGTGEQDRDETLSGHKPFLVIADHLTRAGIAVLRVDDRGVGGSGGSTAKTGFDGKVEDVLAGMSWLASQPSIDPDRIGLLGHSEGGLLAPLAALKATTPKVAFIVLLAGPGVKGTVLLTKQMDATLKAQNVSAERLALGNAGQKKVLDAVVAGANDDALRKIVTAHVLAIAKLSGGPELSETALKSQVDGAMLQVATPAMRDFIKSNPAPVLEKVRCPVLALGGALDLQVPGEENVAAIRAALEKGKNPDVETHVFPGLNH
ncbi:MAG: alpha/beta fold hydrolase, partial [Myxococcales bacterium]|nr:alpha/beta fold hydrolase [Myxococcales bacterium]